MTDAEKEREALLDKLERILGLREYGARDEARALLRAYHDRILEEAVKVCELVAEKHAIERDEWLRGDAKDRLTWCARSASRVVGAQDCAAALRARAPKGERP